LPHYQLKNGRGIKEWTMPDDQLIALGGTMGLNLAKAPKALTPGQAVKAGLPESLLGALSRDVPGAAKLVQFDSEGTRRIFT
jgi:hypothetical protein